MTALLGDTRSAGRRRVGRGRGARARRRRPGRIPDRDGLWARRRRHQRTGRRAPLPSQGPAGLQSAHRPCGRSKSGASAGALQCRRRAARRCILAGTADAGSAQSRRLPGCRARDRRPRHHRGARSGPQGGARYPQRVRQAGGRAIGQPFRSCFADQGRTRPGRSERADRSDHRWRRNAGRRRIRRSSPVSTNRSCCGREACRARRSSARSDESSPTLPLEMSDGEDNAARARHAGVALRAAHAAAAQCQPRRARRGAARLRTGAWRKAASAARRRSTSPRAAILSKRPPICSRTCARSMRPAAAPSR